MDIDTLTMLGPIFVLKQSFVPTDFNRKLVAELWFYPDGSRILELSTKCAPAEMMQVVTETRLYMGDLGITLHAAQETKTKSALQFFAKEAAWPSEGAEPRKLVQPPPEAAEWWAILDSNQ